MSKNRRLYLFLLIFLLIVPLMVVAISQREAWAQYGNNGFVPVVASWPNRPYSGSLEGEPNNSWNQANGALIDGREYKGRFPTKGDAQDYYFFYQGKAGPVKLQLTEIGNGHNYDMTLRSSDLKVVKHSGELENKSEDIEVSIGPGLYYVQVYNWGKTGSSQTYSLVVDYQLPPPPKPTNPPIPAVTATPTPTPTTTPTGIGHIFVLTRDGVVRISPTGEKKLIIPGVGGGNSIEIDNDELLVSNQTYGSDILVYDLDGNFRRAISTPSEASQYLEFVSLNDGRIALMDNDNDKIYFISSSGNLLATVNMLTSPDSSAQNLDGIVVGNSLAFSEDGRNHILQIDLNTYQRSILRDCTDLSHWLGSITYSNGKYYFTGPDEIYTFQSGGKLTKVAEIPEGNITGIEVVGNYAYVSVNFAGVVYKVNLNTRSSSVFASGLNYPKDLEINKN